MKELQCTSKYGQLSISLDICHVPMTDIEGFLAIDGHSHNLLNNKNKYLTVHNCVVSLKTHTLYEKKDMLPRAGTEPVSPRLLGVMTSTPSKQPRWQHGHLTK